MPKAKELTKSTEGSDKTQYSLDGSSYVRKAGDLLKDINGVEFYVSTQWTKQDIDDTIYPVIKQYGWKVYEK